MAKFVEFGQGTASMTPALRELEVRLLNKQLRHGDHPILNMCSNNAVVVGDSGARKFDKARARGRIDGMVALAMAIGVMPTSRAATQVPENRHLKGSRTAHSQREITDGRCRRRTFEASLHAVAIAWATLSTEGAQFKLRFAAVDATRPIRSVGSPLRR